MKKMFTKFSTGAVIALLPVFALAQTFDSSNYIKNIFVKFGDWVSVLVGVLVAVAFLVFVWGLISFLLASGDEKKRADSKWYMVYGILTLFVIVSVWGLVGLVGDVIGVKDNASAGSIDLPSVDKVDRSSES